MRQECTVCSGLYCCCQHSIRDVRATLLPFSHEYLLYQILQLVRKLSLEDALIHLLPGEKYC